MKRQSLAARVASVVALLLGSGSSAWSQEAEKKDEPPPRESLAAYFGMAEQQKAMQARGVDFGLTYIGEAWRIARGGFKRGGTGNGRLEGFLDADLDKLLGWSGATFHMNAFQIHGHGPSASNVGNLLTVSNIEALATTRLYEIWLEQSFAAGAIALRAGQLAADTEFLTSDFAGVFINGTFGWPGITAADLPSGGPAYPFATPGVRLKLKPSDQLTIRLAVFNGDPAGPGFGNPQARNRHGVDFRTRDGAFLIGEAAYAWKSQTGLPGTVKLGGWYNSERFADLRLATDGLLLADPASSGQPRQHRGDHGVYGIVDQMIYRLPNSEDRGVGVFSRVSASPSNRNLIDLYVDGGIALKGLADARPNDTLGFAMAYARISRDARGFDVDQNFFAGTTNPIRDRELAFEATYQAQIVPGWTVQPDIQYIVHPGGRVLNPRDPAGVATIKDALVVGIRTTIKY